jgi:hypothetical protein
VTSRPESQLRSVVGLFNKHADQILTVTTTGTTLQVTPQHPFWVRRSNFVRQHEKRLPKMSRHRESPLRSSVPDRVVPLML